MRLGTDPRVNHGLAFAAFTGMASSGLIGLVMHVQIALFLGVLRGVHWIGGAVIDRLRGPVTRQSTASAPASRVVVLSPYTTRAYAKAVVELRNQTF